MYIYKKRFRGDTFNFLNTTNQKVKHLPGTSEPKNPLNLKSFLQPDPNAQVSARVERGAVRA